MGEKLVDGQRMKLYNPELSVEPFYTTMHGKEAAEFRYVFSSGAVAAKKKGEVNVSFTPDFIVFTKGALQVKKDQLDLYWWLTHHPRNQTNPNYLTADGRKPDNDKISLALSHVGSFLFREKNEELEREVEYDKKALALSAQNHIINEMTEKEAREIYHIYDQSDSSTLSVKAIKNWLLGKAAEDPVDFMDQVRSDVRTIKAKVIDAITAQVIYFDKIKRAWKWSDSKGVIYIVPKGQPEREALIKWFKEKDDGEMFKQLEGAVKDAETAALA